MSDLQIHATTRTVIGPASRSEDSVPAIVYGRKQESTKLSLTRGEVRKVYDKASGSAILDLFIDDNKKPLQVLVQEVQMDPVKNRLLHLDFLAIVAGEAITTEVPLHFVGEAPGAKNNVLVTMVNEIEVKALPKDLPESISVDISGLEEVNDQISLEQITMPKDVELLASEEQLGEPVVKIEPEREEEEEPIEEVDAADVASEHGGDEDGDDEDGDGGDDNDNSDNE